MHISCSDKKKSKRYRTVLRLIKVITAWYLYFGWISIGALQAIESQPVIVVSVESGLRIMVSASIGGVEIPMAVQLDAISLIGPEKYTQNKLAELCPVGAHVTIFQKGEKLQADAFGVIHGIVFRQFPGPIDPTAPPIPADKSGPHKRAIQVEMIRSGWAITNVSDTSIMHEWQREAPNALAQARLHKLGAYSLPEFVEKEKERAEALEKSHIILRSNQRKPVVDQTVRQEAEPITPKPSTESNGF
jgi:hypothetical protein